MGCTCTCPKVDDHSDDHEEKVAHVVTQLQHQATETSTKQLTNDEDEKQNKHSDQSDVAQKRQAPALFCKFGNVVNGMIPFCIENLNHVIDETVETYNLSKDVDTYYKRWNINLFIASRTNNNNKDVTQQQQQWQKHSRNVTPKTNNHNYFIKVPFYVQSYYIVVKIQLQHIQELNCLSSMSDIYKINIASFLIDPQIEIGKLILYRVKDRAYATNGRVLEILDNDESGFDYLVEDECEKDGNGEKKRFKVNI